MPKRFGYHSVQGNDPMSRHTVSGTVMAAPRAYPMVGLDEIVPAGVITGEDPRVMLQWANVVS